MNRLRAIALLAGGLVLTALFLFRFRPSALLLATTIPPAITACGVLLASYAVGKMALGAIRSSGGDLAALLIGYPTFGTLVAIVAWTGIAIQPLIVAMTIVLAASGAWLLWRNRSETSDFDLHTGAVFLLPPIAIALMGAITPVSSPDELIYKLAVPHTYLQYGRMIELPLHSNSYVTLAAHGADLAALALHGGIAAKIARFGIYLAVLAVLLRFCRRIAGDGSWWPVAVVAWTPALAIIAGWAWDEWIVIGLTVLSLEAFEREEHALAFAAAGAAAACKYTALPWLLAFALVAAFRIRDGRALAKGALLVAAFGGFFYLRNLIWTGSPVAPLLLPNSPGVMQYRSGGSVSGWLELVSGVDIFDAGAVDESLGVLMPLMAILSLFAIRRGDRTFRDLVLMGAIQMPILITIAPGSRNMITGLLPLALAGGAMCVEIWREAGRTWRFVLGTVAGTAVIAQLVLVAFVFESYDYGRYLAGRQTASEYIARVRPFATVYDLVEATTPPSARILLLGETRTYHLDRQVIAGSNLDGPRIAAWLERFRAADELRAELTRLGVTHVVIGRANYRVAGGKPLTMLERETVLEVSPRVAGMVTEMLKTRAMLRHRDAQYLVFEMR